MASIWREKLDQPNEPEDFRPKSNQKTIICHSKLSAASLFLSRRDSSIRCAPFRMTCGSIFFDGNFVSIAVASRFSRKNPVLIAGKGEGRGKFDQESDEDKPATTIGSKSREEAMMRRREERLKRARSYVRARTNSSEIKMVISPKPA